MLSSLKMRNQVIKFSALSTLNPDYYFIQGYFMAIGANPHLIKTSQWMQELFGEVDFSVEEQTDYVQALMQLYNQHMNNIMEADIKLPAKCTLSKTDLAASLAAGAPLPNWCLGMLKGLKLINKKQLTSSQLRELNYSVKLLTTFSSYKNVTQIKSPLGNSYEAEAQSLKRYLSTAIHNMIYVMRFESDEHDVEEGFEESGGVPEAKDSEFEKMMFYVMTEEGDEVIQLIDTMVGHFESVFDAQYLKENEGQVWYDHEVRPFMTIRARRAQLNFKSGNISAAIEELQLLLKLNINDNQANRYPLANYLVLEKRWDELDTLLTTYDEESLFMLASKALMLFVLEGDSPSARQAKTQLKKSNRHLEKYLTGQSKVPKETP